MSADDCQSMLQLLRDSVIGDRATRHGPYGLRQVIHADHTAPGRSLSFIEDFIREQVMPLYASAQPEASRAGAQIQTFREDARRIIRDAVGGSDEDAVIFCGSGATAAIRRIIEVLGLRRAGERRASHAPHAASERPVVFLGPYEPPASERQWRESLAEVITIGEGADGQLDLVELARMLQRYERRPLKIGSFSAVSNVTGILADTDRICITLHRGGALAFFDYAAAGPYVPIRMNPARTTEPHLAYKDAVFLSPHKFIGGPGTPGVLVAKRVLFTHRGPTAAGEGTVVYINKRSPHYVDDFEQREEGGAPAVIESIRAGLVFQLKRAIGEHAIRMLDDAMLAAATTAWRDNPNIVILGNSNAPRLAVVSFLIRHHDRYLHHNFVVALLDDLFGIQAHGGCSCAPSSGVRLRGLTEQTAQALEEAALEGCTLIKPGWTRISFSYFLSEEAFAFILRAVDLIARDGWKLLPEYELDTRQGRWHHRHHRAVMKRLDSVSYANGRFEFPASPSDVTAGDLEHCLAASRALFDAAAAPDTVEPADERSRDTFDWAHLRWFVLPHEAAAELRPATRAATTSPVALFGKTAT